MNQLIKLLKKDSSEQFSLKVQKRPFNDMDNDMGHHDKNE